MDSMKEALKRKIQMLKMHPDMELETESPESELSPDMKEEEKKLEGDNIIGDKASGPAPSLDGAQHGGEHDGDAMMHQKILEALSDHGHTGRSPMSLHERVAGNAKNSLHAMKSKKGY